jgi:hypothetical protein
LLKDRINAARASYVSAYREWLGGAWLNVPDTRERFADVLAGRDVTPGLLRPEVRFQMDDPGDRHPVFRQLCVDGAMSANDGDFAAFICEGEAVGERSVTQDYRGMAVTAHPLRWDEIVMRVEQDPTDAPAFVDWATDWMNLNDRRQPGDDGLSGVVHHIAPTRRPRFLRAAGTDVRVDFGSAPTDALWDLLDRLVEVGAPRVTMSSPA